MGKHLIFVYGTLLRGLENSHLLKASTFRFSAVTRDQFYMVSNENNGITTDGSNSYEPSTMLDPQEPYRYPYLLKRAVTDTHEAAQVQGEVYEIETEVLDELDILEEHPSVYRRQEIAVLPTDDIDKEVTQPIEGYVLENEEVFQDLKASMSSGRYRVVTGGSWAAYVKQP